MARFNRILSVALVGATVVGLALMGPRPALAEDNPVVAKVDGRDIHLDEVEAMTSRMPSQYQQLPLDMIFPMLVNSMIDNVVMANEARKQKLNEQKAFTSQMRMIEDQMLGVFLVREYLKKELSDEAVKERYAVEVAQAKDEKETKASHILLKTKADAEAVIKDLDAGKDFAELAKAKSTGPSGPQGGDLGYFKAGQMVPEFDQVAFSLEKGAYTKEPVKSQFGWHVIKVFDRRAVQPEPFEVASQRIRGELARDLSAKFIEKLRGEAKIERFNKDGSEIKVPEAAKEDAVKEEDKK